MFLERLDSILRRNGKQHTADLIRNKIEIQKVGGSNNFYEFRVLEYHFLFAMRRNVCRDEMLYKGIKCCSA